MCVFLPDNFILCIQFALRISKKGAFFPLLSINSLPFVNGPQHMRWASHLHFVFVFNQFWATKITRNRVSTKKNLVKSTVSWLIGWYLWLTTLTGRQLYLYRRYVIAYARHTISRTAMHRQLEMGEAKQYGRPLHLQQCVDAIKSGLNVKQRNNKQQQQQQLQRQSSVGSD